MTSSPESDTDLLATAWDTFCAALRSAGAFVLGQDGSARADGLAHVSQLLSLGLDFFVLNADPEVPEFTQVVTPTRKWALDNPDSLYHRAPVSGQASYRINGHIGSAALLLFDINRGILGSKTRPRYQGGHLTSRELQIDEDGRFEITVCSEKRDGNWLELDPDISPYDFGLVVRQYFTDPSNQAPATLQIERLGEPRASGLRHPDTVATGLRETASFVVDMLQYWASIATDLKSAPNQLLSQLGSRVDGTGANPDNAYFWGFWRLQPGQTLVIRADPAPSADLWNFYVSNVWWEDIDERSFPMKVNSHGATLDEQGGLTMVLGDHDPGYGNFVSTAGNPEGIMLLRLTFPSVIPSLTCSVVET
jgi:hypothetical protein